MRLTGDTTDEAFVLSLLSSENITAERLDGMADDVSERIIGAFNDSPPSPLSRDYNNSAWALLALRQYAVINNRRDWLAHLDFLTKKYFPIESCNLDGRNAFMAACVNWAWLLTDVKGDDVGTGILDLEKLTPLQNPASAHSHGLNTGEGNTSVWATGLRNSVCSHSHVPATFTVQSTIDT